MVGQQMITEARSRNRGSRAIAIAHPRSLTRHGANSTAALVYAFMKPLSNLLSKLRLH